VATAGAVIGHRGIRDDNRLRHDGWVVIGKSLAHGAPPGVCLFIASPALLIGSPSGKLTATEHVVDPFSKSAHVILHWPQSLQLVNTYFAPLACTPYACMMAHMQGKSRNISERERLELRARIESAGLTQEQAAALVYSGLRTMQDWLGGHRQMHRAIYERLLQKLAESSKLAIRPGQRDSI